LLIAGPAGTRERIDRTFDALYPGATEDQRPFLTDFCEFCESTVLELGPATITPFEVRHGSGATPYALRIEYANKVIAYSWDTEWTDSLLDVAEGADLLCANAASSILKHPAISPTTRSSGTVTTFAAGGSSSLIHISQKMLGHLHESQLEAAADGVAITLY